MLTTLGAFAHDSTRIKDRGCDRNLVLSPFEWLPSRNEAWAMAQASGVPCAKRIFVYLIVLLCWSPLLCGAMSTTNNNNNVRQHQQPQQSHDDAPLVGCTFCSETFHSRNKLFIHLRQEHELDDSLHQQLDARDRTAASVEARRQYYNPHHDAYYRRQVQAGVLTLEEWERALEYFQTPLPIAFRKTLHGGGSVQAVGEWLQDAIHQASLSSLDETRQEKPLLQSSPYFTPGSVLIATIPLREWPAHLAKAVADAQEIGVWHRQELCSMLPVALLDIQPHHCVVDLCAAPGSKTLQALDAFYKDDDTPILPTGMLVANDANRQRALVVTRRARRQINKVPLLINSSDARFFPTLRHWAGFKVKFDRIVCDVPCDGDGTLRKLSSREWQAWSISHHLSLHKLQLRILMRALELVRKGGRVVYSTCTLDPVENEAVVMSAILQMGAKVGGISGEYRIVPPKEYLDPDALQAFPFTKGATHWVVPDPKFSAETPQVYENYYQVPKNLRKKYVLPSMFSPSSRLTDSENTSGMNQKEYEQALKYGDILFKEEVVRIEQMLPNCCRILPQHLNSGGFFCAIIERAEPSYYAMFSTAPAETGEESLDLHGRIYHPVESTKHIRDFIKANRKGQDIRHQGLSSLEAAQTFLKQHFAYVVGKSEVATPLEFDAATIKTPSPEDSAVKKKEYSLQNPLFTPLFQPPHPKLLAEFIDFFGLLTYSKDAARAGVNQFPAENVVIVGGGAEASSVTTCVDLSEGRDEQPLRSESLRTDFSRRESQRFFQLCLMSKGMKDLYQGGAKFTPMQPGSCGRSQSSSWSPH